MSKFNPRLIRILAASVVLGALCSVRPLAAQQINLAVLSSDPPEHIANQWQPVLEKLGEVTGDQYELMIFNELLAAREQLKRDRIDFIFAPAYAMQLLNRDNLVEPLLTQASGGEYWRARILVRGDSSMHDIRQLRGKRLLLLDDYSTAGYLAIRLMLHEDGLDGGENAVKLSFSYDRRQSIYALLLGDVDAAVWLDQPYPLLDSLLAEGRVKVLVVTPNMPRPMIGHARYLSPVVIREFQEALREIILRHENTATAIGHFQIYDSTTEQGLERLMNQGGLMP